jgi:hypothetical protein
MKGTAKIAAGVILAVVVMGSMMKGPAWRQRVRIWHYQNILSHLTADQAIALCGRPVLDEMEVREGEVRRRLIIRNYYALAVELDFAAATPEPRNWRLTSIQDPSGEIKYETPASQIGVMPCLDKKEK